MSQSSLISEETAGMTLREAHKALTRERIRNAAKELFQNSSVLAVTMDQIAVTAGVSRPTIYVHYKDKDEIIADIVEAYTVRSLEVNKRIPAPDPSLAEIRRWLDRKVAFYHQEQVSLALLYQAGHVESVGRPGITHELMAKVLEAYAERLPAFRRALEPGGQRLQARARAEMLIRQVTVACEMCAREGETLLNRAALDVTAEAFRDFLDRHAADSI